MSVKLGDRVGDRISRVNGICTARSEFLFGCVRVAITPEEGKDGKPAETFWIDEEQAFTEDPGVIQPRASHPLGTSDAPGGPRDDARRAADPVR